MAFLQNNHVLVVGEAKRPFEFSHEVYGEKFYTTRIRVLRLSGKEDEIPVIAPESLITYWDLEGECISIRGSFRSHNKYENGKRRLELYVFADEISLLDYTEYVNEIHLDGFLCKAQNFRVTDSERMITDLILVVNRFYGNSDYIPCICWGRNAKRAVSFETGTRIKVEGRIQSREYTKKISEELWENRTAYEVSISQMEVVDENSND